VDLGLEEKDIHHFIEWLTSKNPTLFEFRNFMDTVRSFAEKYESQLEVLEKINGVVKNE